MFGTDNGMDEAMYRNHFRDSWKRRMNTSTIGDIRGRGAGRFMDWSFRTRSSKRFTTKTRSAFSVIPGSCEHQIVELDQCHFDSGFL